ncbi:hypothetical protein [Adhaeretor mobilis]|nr:hypothetical protein [Adhaeretor mobilis]
MSVWALSTGITGSRREKSGRVLQSEELVRVPYEGNRNMFAQDGTFTLSRVEIGPASLLADVDLRTVPDILQRSIDSQAKVLQDIGPVMYRISAPSAVAGEILWMLSRERIARHLMFPDYSEVVNALKEEWLHRDP